jgi:hypothetical protein
VIRRKPHAQPASGSQGSRLWRTWGSWWQVDQGSVTAFVVVLTIGILALAGLTLDGGLALAGKVKANGEAEAAARAGAQAINLDDYRNTGSLRLAPGEAVADAQRYLSTVGASGAVIVSGDTVTVMITATEHTQLLELVGISSLTVHGVGSAHPQFGVLTAGS